MKNKINVLAILNEFNISAELLTVNPFLKLHNKGVIDLEITPRSSFKKTDLNNIDLVVFCRNTYPTNLGILNEIRKRKINYMYELDDDLLREPSITKYNIPGVSPPEVYSIKKLLENASLVRVFNDKVLQTCIALNKNTKEYNAHFDFDLIAGLKKEKHEKMRILYATSRQTDLLQDVFSTALKRIASDFKNKVEIFFWCSKINDKSLIKMPNVHHLKPIRHYRKFMKKLYKMDFDIALAPIKNDDFHNSKTNNKYRENGGCGITSIYSNAPLYSNCVIHKETGILTENTEQGWYDSIKLLIENKPLREKIKTNAQKDVKNKYSYEKYLNELEKSIEYALTVNPKKSFSYKQKNVAYLKDGKIDSPSHKKADYDIYRSLSGINNIICLGHSFRNIFPNEITFLKKSGFKNFIICTEKNNILKESEELAKKNKNSRFLIYSLSYKPKDTRNIICIKLANKNYFKNNIIYLKKELDFHEDFETNPFVFLIETLQDLNFFTGSGPHLFISILLKTVASSICIISDLPNILQDIPYKIRARFTLMRINKSHKY